MSERYYYYDNVRQCIVSQYPGEEGYRLYDDGTIVVTDKYGQPIDAGDDCGDVSDDWR